MSNQKIFKMSCLAIFTALIFILVFTGIGYIPIGPGFTLTILTLPLAVGAVTFGANAGAYLGFVFGLTSLMTCLLAMDPMGVWLWAISPLRCVFTCIVPRVMAGYLCGKIFEVLSKLCKSKTKIIAHIVANASAALLNTIFFLSALWLFYGRHEAVTYYTDGSSNLFVVIVVFGGVQALIEIASNIIIGTAITKTLEVVKRKMNL